MSNELNLVVTKDVGIFTLYCEELKTSVQGDSLAEVIENFTVEVNDQYNDYVIETERFGYDIPDSIKNNQNILKWIFENQE
jgi:hypothetical protein